MKRLLSFVIAIEVLGLITACQTTSTGENTASQKETLLEQAGFKWKAVTTPKQRTECPLGAQAGGLCS
jgi:hypothetical protein